MPTQLSPWPRPDFVPGGGDALLFFVVFGDFDLTKPFGVSKYRSRGPADWLEVTHFERAKAPEVFADYQSGTLWAELARDSPVTASAALNAPQAVAVRAEVTDPNSLDYFRDAIGVLTWLLDCGGLAVYDPQRLWLWSADEWRDEVFSPAEPQPLAHTVILLSEEENPDLTWVHTRGMRQYGRPDLSVHNVGPEHMEVVTEMIERFTVYQAWGGVVGDGEKVKMPSLPAGGVCHRRGSLDDPDFNNVHIAIEWASGAVRK
ncbi:hypothetical protein R5W23_003995 [Gemmata sp. JC673]|uniref:DUF4261 domain-containing protein n=1 Tax=Gemmata algarum TaxID=2975278 RepID=A0ABU5F9L8_9BACT|nr:hypothetical protein [Gemmata algarum]MDY3562529.1 hypothetical protein [Gemmata algarum]